jgi:hypothetical protein
MASNVKLISFSDGNFGLRSAGRRLVREGLNSDWFDHGCKHWTIKTLRQEMPEFINLHQSLMAETERGLGNWIWKPAILLHELQTASEGDFIVMLDAGCQLNVNSKSRSRFDEYLIHARQFGLTLVEIRKLSFGFENVTDQAWTKKETLDSLDPDGRYRSSNQIQSGVIIAFNSAKTREFVRGWYEMCFIDGYRLLTSPTLDSIQNPEFIEHRWEQSILSLLAKNQGLPPIPDETYWYPDWSNGFNYPIWTMRNRSGGNAFRRNVFDLSKIAIARFERWINRLI